MLDNLDSIPWKRLEHAGGDASEYPRLLRALLVPNPKRLPASASINQLAWRFPTQDSLLETTLVWQKKIFSATVAAVPFLWEIFDHPGCPGKVETAYLLAEIAARQSELVDPDCEELAFQIRALMQPRMLDLLPYLPMDVVPIALSHFPEYAEKTVPAIGEALKQGFIPKTNCKYFPHEICLRLALARLQGGNWQTVRKETFDYAHTVATVRHDFKRGTFSKNPDEAGKEFGMRPIGLEWVHIDPSTARANLLFLLSTELAFTVYRQHILTAIIVTDEFLSRFDRSTSFYSNGTWEIIKHETHTGYNYGSSCFDWTFDGGVLAIDSDKAGMLWVFDED